jgi:LPXTG-site transpeptidase (sortase) family protein
MRRGVVFQDGDQFISDVMVGRIVGALKTAAAGLRWGGRVFVVVGLFGFLFVYLPLLREEVRYYAMRTVPGQVLTVWEVKVKENLGKPEWEVPDLEYSIYVKKIKAVSRVIADVDAGNPGEYLPALRLGVAQAKGLGYPGEKGTTFLFAHSVQSRLDFARYNAVFYLLDKLVEGDEIEVVYRSKLYKYAVVEREVLAADDTKYLIPQNLAEKLVLQTCYPPGTTWKRLAVVARRVAH